MIKDPVKIIKRFLIVISVLSFLVLFVSLGTIQQLFGFALAIAILSALFNIAMFIVGIRFNTLVKNRPNIIVRFLWANAVWVLFNRLYAYRIGTSSTGALVFVVIYMAAMIYVIIKIKEITKVPLGEGSPVISK
jgi:hypothetical protein